MNPEELRAAAERASDPQGVDYLAAFGQPNLAAQDLEVLASAARRLADVIEQMTYDFEFDEPSGWGDDYDRGYDVAARAVLRIARGES